MNEDKSRSRKAIVILAAGKSSRFKFNKLYAPIAGKLAFQYILDATVSSNADYLVIVESKSNPIDRSKFDFSKCCKNILFVQQEKADGTGQAFLYGMKALKANNWEADQVMCMYGDTPCLKAETIKDMFEEKQEGANVAITSTEQPNSYGYIKINDKDDLEIIEYKERKQGEHYQSNLIAGLFVFNLNVDLMIKYLELVEFKVHGERYLTDVLPIVKKKHQIKMEHVDEDEVQGMNTINEYQKVQEIINNQLLQKAMMNGVFFDDASTVKLSHDTIMEQGARIGAYVIFGSRVMVRNSANILSFSVLSGCDVGGIVGPFAHIRDGVVSEEKTHIGSFVEVKKSIFKTGAKAKHLAYVGDAEVGQGANIGAGVITSNYNSRKEKNKTQIGESVDIGANAVLVAPVNVGNNSQIGAGSVITKNIPENKLAVSRSEQKVLRRIYGSKK